MATRSEFWFWQSQLDKKYCNDLLAEVKKGTFTQGTTLSDTLNKKIRDNTVQWLPRMHNLECVLAHHAMEANLAMGWNFHLTTCFDMVQIAQYQKKQHYNFHNDLMVFTDKPGFERKMTTVLFLSDEKDYDGGELEIGGGKVPTKAQGTIVVFPSFVHHRVTPVTKGTRFSATLWLAGPHFK